ncbi:MAG: class I SAM-dependent methyltransferase [Bacteroidia bacterium]|nr:class I SAM-dependent methyltransferase [Bacteroidia bacterium]
MNINLLKHYILHYFSAKRKGHGVHSPFAYRLCEEVFYNQDSFYHFKALNKIRELLLKNETALEIEDLGAGSKTFKNKTRKIKDIASRGISTAPQSEILYKLSNFLKCEKVIELGTSLGLNTLYLGLVDKRTKVFSIEGNPQLLKFASNLAQQLKVNNIQFLSGNFDQVFPSLLESLDSVDLLYVDGNHTYEATLRYFEMALTKKNQKSVFVFDDIYWSKEMTRAWTEIKNNPQVSLSIDTFHFGMIFFREEIKEKRDLKFLL